jgi:hypothetical protein
MPTVVGVRKELSSDRTHRHIAGVCTTADLYYTREQVVKSLDSGESWKTQGSDGSQASIKKITYCPAPSCYLKPYITTAPDHTTKNNLDNLKDC